LVALRKEEEKNREKKKKTPLPVDGKRPSTPDEALDIISGGPATTMTLP